MSKKKRRKKKTKERQYIIHVREYDGDEVDFYSVARGPYSEYLYVKEEIRRDSIDEGVWYDVIAVPL